MNERLIWVKDYLSIILILTILYGLFLGVRPLTPPDEARYSEIPREMVANHDYVTPRLNGIKYFEKPPLFYWLQCASIKIFGLNELSLRIGNALMGIFGCLITYWGGRRLYNRRVGLIACFILASSLLYGGMSHFITIDITVSTFLTGGLLCFLVGIQQRKDSIRRWNFWMMYVFFALATLTKGLIGFIIPGLIILLWFLICNQWRELRKCYLVSGTLLFLLIILPWHILVQLKNPEFFHFYFIEQHFLRYLTNYAHREQAIWFLPAVLLLGFFPWTGFLYSALKFNCFPWKERIQHQKEMFFIIWGLLTFLFYWKSHSQLAPYILPVFPPLAILTSRYFDYHWNAIPKAATQFGFIFAFILSICLVTGVNIYFYFNPDKIVFLAAHHLIPGLLVVAFCFLSALYCYQCQYFLKGLPLLILGGSLLITTLHANAFDERSVKPLALKLQTIAKQSDMIISYRAYYQDLPFYLQREVKLIQFKGELEFGLKHQDTKEILVDDNNLWQLWAANKQRIFMILKEHDYNTLLKNNKLPHSVVIARTNRNILISNQGTRS